MRATQVVRHIHIDEQFRKECEYEMKQIKANTVREFAERLKGRFNIRKDALYPETTIHEVIDLIAEYILEEG